MYLLDTDTFSLALHGEPRLIARLEQTPPETVWLSVVAAEEVLHGALAEVNKERKRPAGDRICLAYDFVVTALTQIGRCRLLPYDPAAHRLYQSWPASVKRVGPQDCRIAACAIVHGLIVVTRNRRDYAQIPGARFEDWTVPETPSQ